MKLKLPHSSQNWISLIGLTIALISLFMIVFLFAISTFFLEGGSYIGLVVYILLPSILVTGLLLIPIGMLITIRSRPDTTEAPKLNWPRVDLNIERHRNAFFIFATGSTLFLFLSAIGSYEAFHYTESVEFCGTVCHGVMKPEYTAYKTSAHARVACVACHVGTGADWYVKSKMSGLYQVYSVLLNKYPRPIPTPIENLRPARETCEQCHWPQKFYAKKLRLERHYLNDENSSQWDIRLLMKIGSEHSAHGLREGIHWHINPDIKIEYVSADDKNEEIQWIKMSNLKTGATTIYTDGKNETDDLTGRSRHVMDCMDCHNRPSHSYRPPAFFVNEAITAGDIPAALPEIKSLSMEICSEEFSTSDSANKFISTQVAEFYKENYPDIFQEQHSIVLDAVRGLQKAFNTNIFPEMNVRWNRYPNHIGHLEFNGCFRCHNGSFQSTEGQVVSNDCNLCHLITAQGTPDQMEVASYGQSLDFRHPVDIDRAWEDGLCTDCHTGLNP